MEEVAVTSPLLGAEERLREQFSVRVHRGDVLADEDAVADFVGGAQAVITLLANPLRERVMTRCRSLRLIANCAVGFDNIDLAAAHRRGVVVTNTPDVLTDATADLTWALILALTRRLAEGEQILRGGGFRGWALDLLLGAGLQQRRLGVVGLGRIGRAVARRALAFGMEVVYHDRQEVAEADSGIRPVSLAELLATSHVVSLHCPLTPETAGLLNESRLRLMPRGAFLVNTARGQLVDEAALVRVLEDGHLSGAGLDVYEHEPEVHPGLLGRSDVVLLPHVGSATLETRRTMADLAVRNVLAVLAGEEPLTPVSG